MPLRNYLARLIWLCVLPLFLLAAWIAFSHVRKIHEDLNADASSIARNIAALIDHDLTSRIAALRILAISPHANQPSSRGEFYTEAQRYFQNFGSHVIFTDLDMHMLFNTRMPYGTPLPVLPRPKGKAAALVALQTGKPAVGDIVLGPIAKTMIVSIAVPVKRNDKIAFLLLTTIEIRVFQEKLNQLSLPPGWRVSLFDSTKEPIARRMPPNWESEHGGNEPRRFEYPSAASSWSLVLEVPQEIYRKPAVEAGAALAAVILLVTLSVAFVGMLASRRLERSVIALADPSIAQPLRPIISEFEIARSRLAEAVSAREASEAQYRTAFQDAPVGVCLVGQDGCFRQVNKAFCRMLDYTEAELLQKRFADITHPDDIASSISAAQRLWAGEVASIEMEKRYLTKSNSVIWSSIRLGMLTSFRGDPSVIVHVVDITQRKQAEAEMRDSEGRFRAVVEQTIAAVYVIQDGRIVYVNPRMREIFGYGPHETFDPDPMAHVLESDPALVAEQIAHRLNKVPEATYAMTAVRKDASLFTMSVQARRATYEGRPAIIAVAQDITEKARAEEEVRRYITQVEQTMRSTIAVVGEIVQLRDPYTHGHERRVGDLAGAIATEMGLADKQIEGVCIAGWLHDVGKIAVPTEILSKPGKLTNAELSLVRAHAQQSYDILKNVSFPWPIAEAAWQHHERLDGSGYPRGLKDDAIILEARILAVADTVEAMASHRPYRPGLGIAQALDEIEKNRGKLYYPGAVDACLRLFREKQYVLPI